MEELQQEIFPSKKRGQTLAKLGLGGIILALTLCCSLLTGCLGVLVGLKMSDNSLTLDSIIEQLKANNKDTLPSGQIAEACAKTVDSVVTVYGQYTSGGTVHSVSSGVVIAKIDDEQTYLIATCCHGVDGYPVLSVETTAGDRYLAQIVGVDYTTDLALLEVQAPGLSVAKPRKEQPFLGETIIAHGNPLGSVGISTSFGIVSQVSSQVVIGGVEQTLIKLDMALNHGNSGGGVFDMNGELIGIASAKIAEVDGVLVEGVAYAIPSSILYDTVSDLKTKGFVKNRPILGINLQSPTKENDKMIVSESLFSTQLQGGDIIESIRASGLDAIIKDFNGNMTYTQALSAIKEFLVNAKEGQKVTLVIRRQGQVKSITLTVHMTEDINSDI